MLIIACPYCGPREETEFHYGGQAHVPYPAEPEQLTDEEWARYLFYRDNPHGIFAEQWTHRAGCRRWFNVLRDTVTYDVAAVYAISQPQPQVSAETDLARAQTLPQPPEALSGQRPPLEDAHEPQPAGGQEPAAEKEEQR